MATARAETVFFQLQNVVLEEGATLSGIFSWTYNPAEFGNGSGAFINLQVPYTLHDETDLDANIDPTQLIEITLAGSVHDDGVDISLVLFQSLTPTTSADLVIGEGESKYEIGGNGFHTGLFVSGSIVPVRPVLDISANPSGTEATLAWQPDLPGFVLQESPNLDPGSWTEVAGATANPLVIPLTGGPVFYRLTNDPPPAPAIVQKPVVRK